MADGRWLDRYAEINIKISYVICHTRVSPQLAIEVRRYRWLDSLVV
jgi:hypothetical protein